jgi:hypothetical protein
MEKNSLFNHALKFGFIIGIVNIIIGILAYMVGETLMVKWWFGLLIIVIKTIFNILLYQVIDPELPGRLATAAIEQTEQMMTNMGAPADRIDEQLQSIEGRMHDQFSLMGQIKGFGIALIIYAVLSLILGAILKKSEKVDSAV